MASIPVGTNPTTIAISTAPGDTRMYVANTGGNSMSVIDTASGSVVDTVAIDSDSTGGHVVAVSADGSVFVTDAADNVVRILSVASTTGLSVLGNHTLTGIPSGAPGAEPRRQPRPDHHGGTQQHGHNPVTVIDTVTGAQVGSTLTFTGAPSRSPTFAANGTHALITTRVGQLAHRRAHYPSCGHRHRHRRPDRHHPDPRQ